jgi:hypothetical protein
VDQLLADVFKEEVLAPLGVVAPVFDLEAGVLGGGCLSAVDVVQFGHLPQHHVAALPRGRRIAEGVVLRGSLRQACEQRRLREIEL